MARLIPIIIFVAIVVAILWRRKQPPPPLVEVQQLDDKAENRPALRGGEESKDMADLPSESTESNSDNEKQ